MRCVLQRVSRAQVRVKDEPVGAIGAGLLALVAVEAGDTAEDARLLADKLLALRIFSDEAGKMNRNVEEASGAILLVSQFTLLGETARGRRPSFSRAAAPAEAQQLLARLEEHLRASGRPVATGRFGADMQVELTNAGPVTLMLDTRRPL